MNKQEAIKIIKNIELIKYSSMEFVEEIISIISQIHKPQKVKIPQFVAEWYEKNKEGLYETIIDLIRDDERALYRQANPPTISEDDRRFLDWFFREDSAFEILVNMHQFGYEIEQEKRYRVFIRRTGQKLNYNDDEGRYSFERHPYLCLQTKFTKSEIIQAGFGDVFDNPMFKIEEVE